MWLVQVHCHVWGRRTLKVPSPKHEILWAGNFLIHSFICRIEEGQQLSSPVHRPPPPRFRLNPALQTHSYEASLFTQFSRAEQILVFAHSLMSGKESMRKQNSSEMLGKLMVLHRTQALRSLIVHSYLLATCRNARACNKEETKRWEQYYYKTTLWLCCCQETEFRAATLVDQKIWRGSGCITPSGGQGGSAP